MLGECIYSEILSLDTHEYWAEEQNAAWFYLWCGALKSDYIQISLTHVILKLSHLAAKPI